MSLQSLLQRCAELGISLQERGGRLVVDAPDTPDVEVLLAELATRKPEVLAALGSSHNSHNPQNEAIESAQDVTDPRPDLKDDHSLWVQLLRWARLETGDDSHGAYGVLHGIRCGGAQLVWEGHRLRIRPRYSPRVAVLGEGGDPLLVPGFALWENVEEWKRDRDALVPFKDAIAHWLGLLAEGDLEGEAGKQRHAA